jgi:S1-C subfamily serine protease
MLRPLAFALVASFGLPSIPAQQGRSLLRAPEFSAAEQRVLDTQQRRVLDAVAPAVVHVLVRVGGAFRMQRDSTGVVISPDGLVLTNAHLVKEMAPRVGRSGRAGFPGHELLVRTAEGQERASELLAIDLAHDLALLRIQLGDGEKLEAVKLGDSRKVMPGQTLLVCSRPDETVFANFIGCASNAQRGIDLDGKPVGKDDILLSDVNMARFADGAPVFDAAGRLLAVVNSSKARPPVRKDASEQEKREYRDSFGFAMRVHVAQQVFATALTKAKVAVPPLSAEEAACTTGGLPKAVAAARDAVVSVRRATLAESPQPAEPQPAITDPYGKFDDDTLGSGVIVDATGIVLTNAHLVGDGGLTITLLSGKSYAGEVVAKDSDKNVALVKLTLPKGVTLPAIPLANSEASLLGERVAALGNRYGHTLSVKRGVLSSKQRSADVGVQHKKSTGHFQTDANINHGNTGGALINLDGQLLAINDVRAVVKDLDSLASHEADAEKKDATIGFAMPVDWIRGKFRNELTKLVDVKSSLILRPEVSPADLAARESQITRVVADHADCFLNVFVKTTRLGKSAEPTGLMAELFPEPADDKNFRLLGQGSGVIIDPTGLALTNWHVVDAAVHRDGSPRKDYKVFVSLHTGTKYEVEVLSTSRDDDLALLQLKLGRGEQLKSIRLGDSDRIRVGDTAIAVGNPHGFANSVTAGLVAAKGRDIMIKGRVRLFRGMIQTDAAINPGNSGGALIDLNGFLIGINSAGNSMAAKDGYAIPVNYVRQKFKATLLASDKLRSVFLGLQASVDAGGRLRVNSVDAFGPAAAAGIQKDDVILEVQGHKVADNLQFIKLTREAGPFEAFPMLIERGDKKVTAELRPVSDASWSIFKFAGFAAKEVEPATHRKLLLEVANVVLREYTGDPTAIASEKLDSGLLVTHTHPGAVSNGMDIAVGDVVVGHRRQVREIHLQDRFVLDQFTTVKQLSEFVRDQATADGAELELWVVRGGEVIKARVIARK